MNGSSVQLNLYSIVLRGKVSERPAWKDESWALLETDCDWWTGSEAEVAVSSRQLELGWRTLSVDCCAVGRWWRQRAIVQQRKSFDSAKHEQYVDMLVTMFVCLSAGTRNNSDGRHSVYDRDSSTSARAPNNQRPTSLTSSLLLPAGTSLLHTNVAESRTSVDQLHKVGVGQQFTALKLQTNC